MPSARGKQGGMEERKTEAVEVITRGVEEHTNAEKIDDDCLNLATL